MTDKNTSKPTPKDEGKAGEPAKTESPSKPNNIPDKKSPEHTSASKTSTTKTTPSKSQNKKSSSYIELILFVLVVGFIAGTIYYLETQLKEQASLQRYALDEAGKKFENRIQQLETNNTDAQQQLGFLSENQKDLNDAFSSLLKTRRHLRNDWLLAEAEYLMKLANHRLHLAGDTNSALAAMQAADERLHDMGDPAVIPLRKQLAEDINHLKAVSIPDISGLSLTLSALVKSIDNLPLVAPQAEETTDNRAEAPANKLENLEELPGMIWADVKKLLVIREHHGRVKPLLTPEQHFFLKQNLILKLEQAQLALLDQNQPIYKERLQTAMEWVIEFFKAEAPATQNMLTQLKELSAVDIQPALPDISASYRALKDFQEKQADANEGQS
ncbi:MAG: uroporphyrinogen-III C-methyltransferase [Gammaproteobacteria bacterium]|nr:uroporphyrinogen-III C-methyltransferase [Gammaproteobacteria bacterium]